MSAPNAVLAAREGAAGRIRLNSPKTLNALTLESIDAITAALRDFCADPAVALVVIDHAGDKGFCAGGDAIGLARSAREGGGWARSYFERQAQMDALISRFAKPVITIADGITFGGGLGLLLGASRRVITERTKVGFLEPTIGMAPDVGASWTLPRLRHARGIWMALTGAKQIGRACVDQGLANSMVASADLPGLVAQVCADPSLLDAAFPRTEAITPDRDVDVQRHFTHDTPTAILSSLEQGDDWAAEQAGAIRRASPTAIVATAALMRRGAEATSIEQALADEIDTNMALLLGPDFASFARANLLEREGSVAWDPPRIENVAA